MPDTLHIVLLSSKGELVKATASLTDLPEGVNAHAVASGAAQITVLLQPFTTDFNRFWEITRNLGANSIGDDEREFLHTAASAWLNFPPSGEPKDLFIGGVEGRLDVIRTAPKVALELTTKLLAL